MENEETKAVDLEETAETVEIVEDTETVVLENSLEDKLKEEQDKYLRLLAEFDNYRKRTEKEKTQTYIDAVVKDVGRFLPTIDNIGRALEAAKEESESPLYKGIELTYKQLKDTLEDIGVEEIETVGKPFDPQKHNAVAHMADDNLPPNTVSGELLKGYEYKGKVIRVAMVQVVN